MYPFLFIICLFYNPFITENMKIILYYNSLDKYHKNIIKNFQYFQKKYGTNYLVAIDCSKSEKTCSINRVYGVPIIKVYNGINEAEYLLSFDKQSMQQFIDKYLPVVRHFRIIPYRENINDYNNISKCTVIFKTNKAINYENIRLASMTFSHDNFSFYLAQDSIVNKYEGSISKLFIFHNGKMTLDQTIYSKFKSPNDLIDIINRQCNLNRVLYGMYNETYGINSDTIPFLNQIVEGNNILSDNILLNNISNQVAKHGLNKVLMLHNRIISTMKKYYLTDEQFNEMSLKCNYLLYIYNSLNDKNDYENLI